MRVTNKIITAAVAATMLMSTAPVMPIATPVSSVTAYAEATIGEKLTACATGAELDEVLNSITSEECTELGISLDGYASLTAPVFAADAMIKATYTADTFAEVFNTVMAEMLYDDVIENYEIGVSFNATGKETNGIYNGLKFLTNYLSNGNYGTSSYLIYHLDMPSAIVGVKAQITGDKQDAANGRATYISGYSTTEPPFVGKASEKYDPTTDQYSTWATYTANSFTDYKSPKYTFTTSKVCEKDISGSDEVGIVSDLKQITSDTTPFVLRVSKPSDGSVINNQDVMSAKLTITYDNTITLQDEQNIKNEKGAELAACVQAAELDAALKALTDEEIDLLDIDVNAYQSLAYPTIAADAILKQEYSDYVGFKTTFDNVMAEMLYTEVINNYDMGVMVNATENTLGGTIKPGLTFTTNYLTNGTHSVNSGSYLIYDDIPNPYAIKSIKAQITGEKQDATNGRATYISGYSTTEPPFVGSVNGKYDLTTEQYSKWAAYTANSFTDYKSPVYPFKTSTVFENDISGSDEVGIVRDLNVITSDTTPLVLRVSKPSDGSTIQNQNVMSAKLTIAYDKTVIIKKQQDSYDALINSIINCESAEELDTALQALTSSEAETLGLDLTEYNSLAYPEYAAEAIFAEAYSSIDEFKTAFDNVMAEMLYTEVINNYDMGVMVNTTESKLGGTIEPGLTFVKSYLTNGTHSVNSGSYLIYGDIANPYAIKSIKAQITGEKQDAANGRATYISGYSTTEPPFVGSVYGKYGLTTEQYSTWATYTANSFTDYKSPVYPFKTSTVFENDISGIVSDLNAITSDTTPLVLRVSKPSDGSTIQNQNIMSAKLTIAYDKTVVLYNIENGFNEVITAVNAITNETADADVLAVIDSYLSSILTDSTLTDKFNELANSVQIQIMKDLSAQKNTEISAMQSAMAALVTVAEDVEIKYNVTAFPFLNYTDSGASKDECVGWVNEMTVKKLTNSTEDFAIVLAAYSGGRLTDVALINEDNVPTNSQYANTYTTLKNAKDGEEQTIYIDNFFTEFQPDAVKVFIFNSMGNLKPIAEVYEVADPKAIKTAE